MLIRLDRATSRLILIVLGVALALAIVFGVLHVLRFRDNLTHQFTENAALSAQIFAESINFETPTQQILNRTRQYVSGDVLFAQIILDGSIVAEDRAESALELRLPLLNTTEMITRSEAWLRNGHHYLDILRALSAGEHHGYVRVGFSMREIDGAVMRETLIVVALGIAVLVLLLILLGAYLYRKEGVASPISSVSGKPELNGNGNALHNGHSGSLQRWLEAGPLRIDESSKVVQLRQNRVELSPKEYDLVNLLASEPDRVFSNQEILQKVWADGYGATAKDVKQYIYLLRKKLENDPESPELIVTVRGFGYKLVSSGQKEE